LRGASGDARKKALLLSAGIAHDRMILADTENREADGVAQAKLAATRLEAFEEMGNPDAEQATIVGRTYANIALFSSNSHQLDDAARYGRRAIDVIRRFSHDQTLLASSLGILSNAERFSGDLDAALQAIHESRLMAETAARPDESRGTI